MAQIHCLLWSVFLPGFHSWSLCISLWLCAALNRKGKTKERISRIVWKPSYCSRSLCSQTLLVITRLGGGGLGTRPQKERIESGFLLATWGLLLHFTRPSLLYFCRSSRAHTARDDLAERQNDWLNLVSPTKVGSLGTSWRIWHNSVYSHEKADSSP